MYVSTEVPTNVPIGDPNQLSKGNIIDIANYFKDQVVAVFLPQLKMSPTQEPDPETDADNSADGQTEYEEYILDRGVEESYWWRNCNAEKSTQNGERGNSSKGGRSGAGRGHQGVGCSTKLGKWKAGTNLDGKASKKHQKKSEKQQEVVEPHPVCHSARSQKDKNIEKKDQFQQVMEGIEM
ncbi:hypothetical protein IW262DRAFT_1296663 [Armillaria fumosa]|nr:hypothetical protein IW262DRAFT_1296663 [Armillaria fumosa]